MTGVRRWATSAFVLLGASACTVQANARVGNWVGVGIEVAGRRAPLYHAVDGTGRFYFEALEGSRYEVVLENRTGHRLGVVVDVDGLNVISGELEQPGEKGRMYILAPYGKVRIRGWRRSLEHVHRFEFVDEKASYAARVGKANSKMGWLQVAVYRERNAPVRRELKEMDDVGGRASEAEPSDRPAATEAPQSAPIEEGVAGESRADGKSKARRSYPGTGWGNRVKDQARIVDFDPESNPVERITLRYEYQNALVALGVLPEASPWPGRLHQRDSGRGFAEPPR